MKFQRFYGGVLTQPIKKDYLDNTKLLYKLHQLNCPELLTRSGSAVNKFDFLADFMKSLKPEPIDIIEIGTLMGLGTLLLASYCRTVSTFDILYRNSHPLWKEFGMTNKINCYTGNQDFIDTVISYLRINKQLNFNFAFIDGEHTYNNVKHDFALVQFCKRVLFHDVNIPEVRKFVIDEIGGKVVNENTEEPAKFGYWEAN